MREENMTQEQRDQRDLAHTMRDPKRYAEVSARIRERKREEEDAAQREALKSVPVVDSQKVFQYLSRSTGNADSFSGLSTRSAHSAQSQIPLSALERIYRRMCCNECEVIAPNA